MANKIYAVKKGLVPGIYNTWDECKQQVNGYSGAEYKSFKSSQISDAIEYVGVEKMQVESNANRLLNESKLTKAQLKLIQNTDPGFGPAHAAAYTMDTLATSIIKTSKEFKGFAAGEVHNINAINLDKSVDIYTDGSFKNGRYSYAFVIVANNEAIYWSHGVGTDEGAASMQNVAGELSAAMHAICWARDHGYTCRIFHDYEGVGAWAIGIWKAKDEHTKAYVQFIKDNPNVVTEFIHVYGHTGNKFNELADQLAGQALKC